MSHNVTGGGKQMARQTPQVDALDFEGQQAVVVERDEHSSGWTVWHIRPDDTAGGWVRQDWLQEVEQGFQFEDETAIKGFNWFPEEVA
jgi:hypothetical protein